MRLALLFLLLFSSVAWGQSISLKIINQQDEPVKNATAHLLNSNIGGVSDKNGQIILTTPINKNCIIELSALGYATQTFGINIENNISKTIILLEATQKLDELIVTAEKKEALAQRIPMALTVLSSQAIEAYRLWDIRDITAIIPNLNITNPGDGKNNISLRGITSASYDQPIATYIDGVNQVRLDAYIPQLLNVERIEVLRGPQGTLYGRNAMGGVINIITKQPNNETNGFAEIAFGNYGQQRYSAGFNTPLIKNKLFFGAALLYSKQGGFFTNVYTNSPFDKAQGLLGNYTLNYKPTQKLSFSFNLKHYNRQNDGSFPLINSAIQAFLSPFKVNYNAITTDYDNTINASLAIKYFGSKVNFSSISAYQSNARYYAAPIDADVQLPFKFASLDVNSIEIKNDNGENTVKFWTQEFRINSTESNKSGLQWTAGSFLFTQDAPTAQALGVGIDGAAFGQEGGPYQVTTNAQQNNYGIAIYGQSTYNLSENLSLTAGLRYDYEHQQLMVGSKFIKGTYIETTLKDTTAQTSFAAISPKLALSYSLSKAQNSLLYMSYARGFRTGGLSQISYDPSDAPLVAFKPEFSDNFEFGIKTTGLHNKLRANATFFLTKVSNAQIPTLIPELGFRTATQNAGNLQASGIEIEIATLPIPNLEIAYNLGYTHATYTKLSLGVTENEKKIAKDFSGNYQILTPDISSMLAIQYGFNILKNLKLLTRSEWKHLGTQYFDLQNTLKQAPYDLLNVKLGIATKHIDIMFWGRNLGDKLYLAYGYNFGAVTLGNPKTIGISITGRF